MTAKIEIITHNGELPAATQELLQQRLEKFAVETPQMDELNLSVDLDIPAKPVVGIMALIGEKKLVIRASEKNVVSAVEDAILRLQHRLEEPKEQSPERKPKSRDDSAAKIRNGMVAVLVAGIVGYTILWITSNPTNYPGTAPVTGTVTLDGRPLKGASINFTPFEGRSSGDRTNARGRYELRYLGNSKGALLGMHRVTIRKLGPDLDYVPTASELEALQGGEFLPPWIDFVPERYHGKTSELSAEVKPTNNVIDFALVSE